MKRLSILVIFIRIAFTGYTQLYKDSSHVEVLSVNRTLKNKIISGDTSNIDSGLVKKITTEIGIWGDTLEVCYYFLDKKHIRTDFFNNNRGMNFIDYYKDGKPHGESFTFKNGKIQNYVLWNEWDIITRLNFHENGQLEGYSFTDTLNQIVKSYSYYESGKIMVKSNAIINKNDPIHDTIHEIRYYESGNTISENYYNAGKQKMVAYFDNGKLMEEYSYIDMNLFLVGELKYYYENGKLKQQAFFKDGNTREEANYRIGNWSWWDEKGNLVKQEIYRDNELVETKEFLPKVKEKEK